MSEFDEHWHFAKSRGEFQQQYNELQYVYALMKACECNSYLEVGTAEGSSLYILGQAMTEKGAIEFIDFGEEHTQKRRDELIWKLSPERSIVPYLGDSTRPLTYPHKEKVDCVLIDGGHDFATVLSDSILYAPLATKYIFWHDIQLPDVRAAVEWFVKRWDLGEYSTFINSTNFGYGIVKCHSKQP